MDREVPELCVTGAGGNSSSGEMYHKKRDIQLEEWPGNSDSRGASGVVH